MALGLYFCRDYAAAVEIARRAIRSYPDFPNPYRWLAAALGQLGRVEEANEALQQAIAILPGELERCRGCGRKTTPICSKVCARPAGRASRRSVRRR